MKDRATRIAAALLAILAIVVAWDNLERPLANPDEGRYSEISREMAASGDWITPRLNGIKYLEKPPLQYWATALSFRVFGEGERAARLYVALCGLATMLIAGFVGWRLHSPEAGLFTILALFASPYFLGLGGVVTLDMGLTLWTTVTLGALLLAFGAAKDERERRRWLLAGWGAMALAVLSKGLVGIVFPAAALFFHVVLTRDWRILVRLEWMRGPLVFLAIAAPWFIAVSLANPEFPEFFFIHEHFTRFLTKTHRRVEPWHYFLPIVFAGFLPWMFALPAAAHRAWTSERDAGSFPALRLALLWAAFVIAFFSASGSKLPGYILPAFPALALVLGRYLATTPAPRLALWLLPLVPTLLLLAYFIWDMPWHGRDDWTRAMYIAAQPWGYAAVAVLLATGAAAFYWFRRGDRWLAAIVLAAGVTVSVDCGEDAYEELAPRQSGMQVAEKMKPLLTPATRVYSVRMYDQTVPFYIGRTVTLVDYTDEFETGLASEPGRRIEFLGHFVLDWLREGDAMAIIQPDTYPVLRSWGLPMQVVHEDPRRVLVRKR